MQMPGKPNSGGEIQWSKTGGWSNDHRYWTVILQAAKTRLILSRCFFKHPDQIAIASATSIVYSSIPAALRPKSAKSAD